MIRFERPENLKFHEKVDKEILRNLMKEIISDGMLRNPIVVEKKTKIILDGHHRCEALKKLGFSKVPVFLVDYRDSEIRVISRNGLKVSKYLVLQKGLGGEPYPPKTTKHIIPKRPKNINIEVEKLK